MKKLALIVFGALVGLCIVQLAIYVTAPPNNKNFSWGKEIRRNRIDFREREFAAPKPAGIYRIMVIGDSLTEGPGLSYNERFTAVLERMLNRHSRKPQYEVLNFGIGGHDTTDELSDLKKFGSFVQPDRIIVGFCLNDIGAHTVGFTDARGKYIRRWDPVMLPLYHGLRKAHLGFIAEYVYQGFLRLSESAGFLPNWITASEPYYYDHSSREWKDFVSALTQIKSMSDGWHLRPPIFTVLNMAAYLLRPTDYAHPDDKLRQMLGMYHKAEEGAAGVGFVTCNVEAEFASQLGRTYMVVNAHDAHPNAAMNKIYAEKLYLTLQPT